MAGRRGWRGDESAGSRVRLFERLMESIDGEGDGPGEGLAEEPPFVVSSVDDVDAADEESGGEETDDAEEDEEGASRLRESEVAEAREEEREEGGERFGAFLGGCWVGHLGGVWARFDRVMMGGSVPPVRGPTGGFARAFGGNANALGTERTLPCCCLMS